MSATILTPAWPARATDAAHPAAAVATFTSTPPVAVAKTAPPRGVLAVPAVLIQRHAAAVDLNHKMALSHLGLALERLAEANTATGEVARDALAKATGHAKLATRHLAEADAAIAKLRQMPGEEG